MIAEFETSMLHYLNSKDISNEFRDLIDGDLFENWEHQVLLAVQKSYFKEFSKKPSLVEYQQYMTDTLKKDEYEKEEINDLIKLSKNVFEKQETTLAKDILIKKAQYKQFKLSLAEHASNASEDGESVYNAFIKSLKAIQALANDEAINLVEKSPLLFQEGAKFVIRDNKTIIQTPFVGLNQTLAAGGMFSPQFATFMGGSKAFKTGIAMAMAVGFVRLGQRVAFLDGENGYTSIENRFIQHFLDCTLQEIIKDEFNEEHAYAGASVEEVYNTERKLVHEKTGGEFIIISFVPNTSTMADVYDELEEYRERDFNPSVLILDDVTHYLPSKEKKNKHENIEQVVHDIFKLNRQLNSVCISPSQVKVSSLEKEKFDSGGDMGEAYAIYKYASLVMSINQNPLEKHANIMRLSVTGGRDGKSDGIVASYLKLDKERMQVDEIASTEAESILSTAAFDFDKILKEQKANEPKKKLPFKRKSVRKKLTDD